MLKKKKNSNHSKPSFGIPEVFFVFLIPFFPSTFCEEILPRFTRWSNRLIAYSPEQKNGVLCNIDAILIFFPPPKQAHSRWYRGTARPLPSSLQLAIGTCSPCCRAYNTVLLRGKSFLWGLGFKFLCL